MPVLKHCLLGGW